MSRERQFVDLYERHYHHVYAYARRRAPEPAARDVAAETFLVAWRRLDDALGGELPWLYRTAALTLSNWRRGERRHRRTAVRLAALAADPAVPDPADHHADRDPVLRAVRALPAADRELLLLVTWEQLDVQAAASVVGCFPNAAAVRLHRARKTLRDLLADPSPALPEVTR